METAGTAKELLKNVCRYTNSHCAAKSVVNAVILKAQLGEPSAGEYPPELIEHCPEIRDLVARPRPPSGFHIHSSDGFTVTLLMMSVTSRSRTTSIPEVT